MYRKYPRYEFKISFPKHTVESRVLQNSFCVEVSVSFLFFDVQIVPLLKITPLFSGFQSLIRRDIFSRKQDLSRAKVADVFFFNFATEQGCSRGKFLIGGT